MRPGHHPRRPVLLREIVQQPDGITNPKTDLVRPLPRVIVQLLQAVPRQRRPVDWRRAAIESKRVDPRARSAKQGADLKLALLVLAGGGGTLAVNVLGALVFGIIWALAEKRIAVSPELRTVVLVGFLGGFTMFATFAFETVETMRNGDWWTAAANLAAQNGLGIAALYAGLSVGRAL